MAQLFLNNCHAYLDAGIDDAQTSITLAGMSGFPSVLGSGDYFLLTIYADGTRYGDNFEVVKVVDLSGSTLLVERGYEGNAISHVMGEPIEARLTALSLTAIQNTVENLSIVYDGSGNITGTTEVLTDGRTRSSTFGYDSGGNVTTVEVTFEGVTRTETYTYDGAGNVTGMSTAQEFVV